MQAETSSSPALPIDEGQGATVLLVHGQPGGGADWEPVARLLAADYHVLAPDRPGWGANPRPATTLRGNAAALARLCSDRRAPGALLDTSPVVVVGHSLGGGIALLLALEHPELVGALVLVAPVGVGEALGRSDRLLAVPVLGSGMLRAGAAVLHRGADVGRRLSERSAGNRLIGRVTRSGSLRAVMAEGEREVGARERRSFLVEQRAVIEETPAIESRLPSLRVPCVVIHGRADHIVPVAAGRRLAGVIPGAELVTVARAGHRIAFEQPELVADAVRRYSRLAGTA